MVDLARGSRKFKRASNPRHRREAPVGHCLSHKSVMMHGNGDDMSGLNPLTLVSYPPTGLCGAPRASTGR